MLSIKFPSKVDLSWQYDLLDLALKSTITTTKKGFLWTIFSKFNSKFLGKVSKSSKVWLGDLIIDFIIIDSYYRFQSIATCLRESSMHLVCHETVTGIS